MQGLAYVGRIDRDALTRTLARIRAAADKSADAAKGAPQLVGVLLEKQTVKEVQYISDCIKHARRHPGRMSELVSNVAHAPTVPLQVRAVALHSAH